MRKNSAIDDARQMLQKLKNYLSSEQELQECKPLTSIIAKILSIYIIFLIDLDISIIEDITKEDTSNTIVS